ncbi:MAG TPA: hypothetical protein VJZ69_02625 [Clostridia bacterium]|nr:hypothetical protein [Clostridia bacterium]
MSGTPRIYKFVAYVCLNVYIPGYENGKGGNYRKSVVIDSNRSDELAIVKLTKSKKGTPLKEYKNGESTYRPFVYTADEDNNPIKTGKKFIPANKKDNMSKKDVTKIKKECVQHEENRDKLRKLKGREKWK